MRALRPNGLVKSLKFLYAGTDIDFYGQWRWEPCICSLPSNNDNFERL